MRCLITEDFHSALKNSLESEGILCDTKVDILTQEVMEIIPNYEILIVNSKILVDEMMIDAAVNLKVIGRVGSGMEIIDVDYCKNKGIKVFSAPEGNCDSVGEHALGLLLNVLHNISKADKEIRLGHWYREENRGETLEGKTLGIIGYGHTGKAFAKKMQGFEMNMIAYDVHKVSNEFSFVQLSDMQEVFQKADIVSLHVPLEENTYHLANRSFFNAFVKPIFFINTSRGKVCDTAALVEALKSGKILGAGLDVFENERPASFTEEEKELYNTLYGMPNVVLTPHIAGWTHQSKEKLARVIASKIINSLK